MRTAICISGHIRWYKDVFRNFVEMVFRPFRDLGEVDVFIHIWDEVNSKNTLSARRGDTLIDCEKVDSDELIGAFGPKSILIEDYELTKDKFTVDKFYSPEQVAIWDYEHEKDSNHTRVQQCIPMFYKWFQCNELKKGYEESFGFKYDWVMKCRLDMFYFHPIQPKLWDKNLIYNRGGWDDLLFFASSKNMDIITGVYPNLKNIIDKHNVRCDDCNAHPLFKHYLNDNGIDDKDFWGLGESSFYTYPRQRVHESYRYIFEKENRLDYYVDLMNIYGKDMKFIEKTITIEK